MIKNFDEARERMEQSPKDWKFGTDSVAALVTIPEAERQAWLPDGEQQFDSQTDFEDCASRSPVNHMEAILSYHYAHAMKPVNQQWMRDKGYVSADGKITLSKRFIAILSGTTHSGNSLKAPVDTIRTRGLIPEALLVQNDSMAWADYYNATDITPALIQLGLDFLARFQINYEQIAVAQFDDTEDMIGVAGYAWAAPDPVTDIYPAMPVSAGFNHAFLYFQDPKYRIFDNYVPFIKQIASDYNFFEYGYRMYISAENIPAHVFLENLAYQIRDPEVTYLQAALVSLGYSIPNAVTTYYGQETKVALAKFQADNGIVDDGTHFGPRTRNALNQKMNPGALFGGSFSTAIASLFSGV